MAFDSMDQILKCDHSDENYLPILFYNVAYYAVDTSNS